MATFHGLLANPSSSGHIFVGLIDAAYLSSTLNTPLTRVHELDWWDERLFRVSLPSNAGAPAVNAEVRLSCTPSQHVSGRTGLNRSHALWASTRTREYILLATLDTVRSATEKTKTKFRYAPHLSNLEYVDSVDVAFNHRVRDDSFFYHIDTNFNLILID